MGSVRHPHGDAGMLNQGVAVWLLLAKRVQGQRNDAYFKPRLDNCLYLL